MKVSELFYGFCNYFSSLGITAKPTPSMWKYRVYYYFDMLGRMLGYDVSTEDTFTKEDGFKNLCGKRIDMTWAKPNSRDYALALEYENTKAIDDEIEKLASTCGLRVLVMFKHNFRLTEVSKKIRSSLAKTGDQTSDFFVIILPKVFTRKKPFEKLICLLIDKEGRTKGCGKATGYVSANGVCSFQKAKWMDL